VTPFTVKIEETHRRISRRWPNISTGFILERELEEGVPSKRARAHCHTQA
jgi:hypothetical protein